MMSAINNNPKKISFYSAPQQQQLTEDEQKQVDMWLFRLILDQKTLSLAQSLLVELSISPGDVRCEVNNQLITDRINLMEGILKVLEWRAEENITEIEFEQLFMEWLNSRGFSVQSNLLSFHYSSLVPEIDFLSYLRRSSFQNLSATLSVFMETLNNQLNNYLLTSKIAEQNQIETCEDIYLVLDEQGMGLVGIDQMVFLFMSYIKMHHIPAPSSRRNFDIEFSKFISSIPQQNGYFSLRSLKYFFIKNNLTFKELNELLNSLQQIQQEFKWGNNLDQNLTQEITFPKPFTEAFIETMHELHQQGHITDEDLMRDEYLNAYNVFLQKELFQTSRYYDGPNKIRFHSGDPDKLSSELFRKFVGSEIFPNQLFEHLHIQPSQITFIVFVEKFDAKMSLYILQFLSKYARNPLQCEQIFEEQGIISKPFRGGQDHFPKHMSRHLDEKENFFYKPRLQLLDYKEEKDVQQIEICDIGQRTIVKDQKKNLNFSNNVATQSVQSSLAIQQPLVKSQRQQLLSQFITVSNPKSHIEQQKLYYLEHEKVNKNLTSISSRSKSPIPRIDQPNHQCSKSPSIHSTKSQTSSNSQKSDISQVIKSQKLYLIDYLKGKGQNWNQRSESSFSMNSDSSGLKGVGQKKIMRNSTTPTKQSSISPIKMFNKPSTLLHITQMNVQGNQILQHGNQFPRYVQKSRSSIGSRHSEGTDDSYRFTPTSSMGFRESTPIKSHLSNSYIFDSQLKEKQSMSKRSYVENCVPQLALLTPTTPTNQLRSKSPLVRKVSSTQMWNKRVESYELVMQRLTLQAVSPIKESKKRPFH